MKIRISFFTFIFLVLIFFLTNTSLAEVINLQEQNNNKQDSQVNPEIYKTLTLKEAIDMAMEKNHHVKSAIATLPVSQANLIIAKYIPNPTFNSNGEFVKNGSLHPVQIGQSLEIGRKRHWRIEVAKEEISKTELEIAKTLWEIHTQVHTTYSGLSVGIELYNLAKERADFYRSLFDIASKRFQAGDISKLDLERARLELLSVENDLSDFTGRLKKAKVDFNHILGNESGEEVNIQNPEQLKPKIKLSEYTPLQDILKEALNKRIDLAIIEKDFGIIRAKLKKAQWEKLPNLYIEGGPARPSFGTNIWGPYLATQFELPIFNRRQGEIKQARAQIEYYEKEEERIKHDINIEVTNAQHDLEVREEQLQRFQEKLLEGSEDILEMIKTGYQKGKLSLTDVLNAEQQNRDLRRKYLESLYNYQFALASLEYAVGVPLYGLTEEK